MRRARAQYGLSPAGAAGFGFGATGAGAGFSAVGAAGAAGFSAVGVTGAAGSDGSLGGFAAAGFGAGRCCSTGFAGTTATGTGFGAGTTGAATAGFAGAAEGAAVASGCGAADAGGAALAGGAPEAVSTGTADALAAGGATEAAGAGSALADGAGVGGEDLDSANATPAAAAMATTIRIMRPPPLFSTGAAAGTETRRLAGAADTADLRAAGTVAAFCAADPDEAGRPDAAGRAETGFGSAGTDAGPLPGGSERGVVNTAAAGGWPVETGAAGGSAYFGAAATSSMELPVCASASCKSSRACFITVRSSGAGMSASDFVSGKNEGTGLSATGATTGGRFDGFIAPSPIMVCLRIVGIFGGSPMTPGAFEDMAAAAGAGVGTLPVSPPPASYALLASPRDSTRASITLREASSILMNFTPMPAGRASPWVSLSRFQTTRPTP